MTNIHPSAIIHPDARISDGVAIGPFCVIGQHVQLGAGTVLQSQQLVATKSSVTASFDSASLPSPVFFQAVAVP